MHSATEETPELIARRQAAWAVTQLCNHVGLGTLAERFDPEYPDEWSVLNTGSVKALKNKVLVAEVLIEGEKVTVIIPDIHLIVRQQHLADFIPEEFGITHKTGENFMGDVDPDLVADFPLPEDKTVFRGSPRPMPRSPRARIPKVIGSL